MLLKAVKVFHTLAWFTIEACMLYVLYSGIRGQSDRRAGLAAIVVALETLVFAANGFHCPLTGGRTKPRRQHRIRHRHLPPTMAGEKPPGNPRSAHHHRRGPSLAKPLNHETAAGGIQESTLERARPTDDCAASPHRPGCAPVLRACQPKHL
jgi:hypothetical protein